MDDDEVIHIDDLRTSHYEKTMDHINVHVYVKQVDFCEVNFDECRVTCKFSTKDTAFYKKHTGSGNKKDKRLFCYVIETRHAIEPAECSHTVKAPFIEVVLKKKISQKWNGLHGLKPMQHKKLTIVQDKLPGKQPRPMNTNQDKKQEDSTLGMKKSEKRESQRVENSPPKRLAACHDSNMEDGDTENEDRAKMSALAAALDGTDPVIDPAEAMDTLDLADEPLIDGVPASKAFRNREIMLLQAVAEKYKNELGADVDASVLVRDFLGTDVNAAKLTNVNGDIDDRGVLDIDTALPSESNGIVADVAPSDNLVNRSKYIPLRLNLAERKRLRLCEAALNVSEYTDKVDILIWKSKNARIHEQLRDICAILSGLAVAADYNAGQRLIEDKDFKANEDYFQDVFEIGRRHKILNPERMRTDYGKLIHMLMDSQLPEINRLLDFRLVKKVKTVHKFLEERNALELLARPEALVATSAISDRGKTRLQVQRDVKTKEAAVKRLINDFSGHKLSREEVEWCLYSLSDNSAFLYFNRDPINHMIDYLKTEFPEGLGDGDKRSLAIRAGVRGARLSHGHKKQYQFAIQTLSLWREIQNDMFKLWYLAEEDLLNENNYYSLRNTGQGLNRVQSAPSIGKAMYDILHRVQNQLGSWVGSSVVHLGDHNVPNALTFIDKYTQVPRILNPIVNVIESIPRLADDPHVADMIQKAHGSVKDCQRDILQDFFKHAFDGSGADNFYDAGSCIDGRLTSAWNWCNKLDKKAYYSIFKLAGFNGFDGDFKT